LGEICKWRGSVAMATVVCEGASVCVYMVYIGACVFVRACACVCVSNKRGTPCDCAARFYGTPPRRILVYSHTHTHTRAYKHFPSSKSCPVIALSPSLSISLSPSPITPRATTGLTATAVPVAAAVVDRFRRGGQAALGACACAPVHYNIMYTCCPESLFSGNV